MNPPPIPLSGHKAVPIFLIGLAATALLAPGALLRDFWIYNEGRRAIIGLAMIQRGDWIVPRLMGTPILTKTPLFYWLEALAFQIFGAHDWAARLPSLLAAVGGCLVLYGMLSRLLRDRAAAAFGALALAVTPIYAWMAPHAEPEMTFVFFGILALDGFTRARLADRPAPGASLTAWLALGLAFMVKGPLVPIIVALTLLFWRRALRGRLPSAPPRSAGRLALGIVLMLAPFLAWALALLFSGQPILTMLREVQSHLDANAPHAKGFFYYAKEIDNLCLPWAWLVALALVEALVAARRGAGRPWRAARDYLVQGRGERLLLVVWLLVAWLALSVVPSKRYYYGLALAPPLAALAALVFHEWRPRLAARWRDLGARPRSRLVNGLRLLTLALLLAALLVHNPDSWGPFSGESGLDAKPALWTLAIWLAGVVIHLRAIGNRGGATTRGMLAWTLVVMAAVSLAYTFGVHRALNAQLSYRRAAEDVRDSIPTGAEIYSIQSNHTICFYLGRPDVPVLNDRRAVAEYARAHPGSVAVVTGEYLDLLNEAGPYEILYRSTFIAVPDAQVYILRVHPRP
jgi:4-amino-4-deoxy-L-arabinose transferase-like glycosyltransferase